jgi:membrane protease YdiL (CAAX protease family)
MSSIKMIFWNADERRLRAIWRLVIFSLVFGVMLAGVQTLIYYLLPGMSQRLQDDMASKELVLNLISQTVVLAALVITLLVIGRWIDRRSFSDYGYHWGKRWGLDFAFGLCLGAFLMIGIFVVEYLAGWIDVVGFLQAPAEISFTMGIFIALALFISVAFMEETLIRGYLLHNLAEGLNFKFWNPTAALILAWVLSSGIFGLLHLGNPHATLVSTVNIAIAGLFLGLGYILTGDLGLPIGLHLTWNLFQGNIFGFPVSGTSFNSVTFIAIEQKGAEMWTGGAFGPEAGLIGLIAMIVGALLVLGWVKWRYGRIQLQYAIPLPPQQKTSEAVLAPDA